MAIKLCMHPIKEKQMWKVVCQQRRRWQRKVICVKIEIFIFSS